ncbi:helix-turn-helix domain-containing protein [Moorena producens JHB]|uniref:Helix-turn-helix domain-containing protein n=1 Tax=Moorena producens (strain JHB) TaxID=1454205 RepID=A0A1D9GBJ3_MOOP1|nr:helix-turn-helix domain-containing protein [Moorena producens]AOY84845.2 helix-turn-helix domain-containing protein [Moorena producens JHB]
MSSVMDMETDSDIDIKTNSDSDRIKKAIEPCLSPCPIERGMRILGGKWKGSILWHLKDGPMRFNDLARQIGGASKKMVTQRLREMEDTGLVNRNVISTKPIAVTYEITDFGRTALNVLEELKKWAEEYNI